MRAADTWHAGAQCAVSEPLFVPKPGRADEGAGYLLVVVYDESRNASHLTVLDAGDIKSGPKAQAMLDHRVPLGFHGLWVEPSHCPP